MNAGTEARKCMKIVEFQKCPGVMHEWVKTVWTSRQMHEAWQVWLHVSTKYVREIYGWWLPLTFTQSPSVSEFEDYGDTRSAKVGANASHHHPFQHSLF